MFQLTNKMITTDQKLEISQESLSPMNKLAKYGFDPIIVQPSLTPTEADLLGQVMDLRAFVNEELDAYKTTNATKTIDKLIAVRTVFSKMVQGLTAASQRVERCALAFKGMSTRDMAYAFRRYQKRRRFEIKLQRLVRHLHMLVGPNLLETSITEPPQTEP